MKIATPILFESSLDELNRLRPLQLSDKSQFSLDLPVLSKNPVGTGRPIIGKFGRCDEQGALLRNKGNSFKNYELIYLTLNNTNPTGIIQFSQRVFGVSICSLEYGNVNYLYLCDSSYIYQVARFSVPRNDYINFTGFTLYVKCGGPGTWISYLYFYGLY